MGTVTVSAAKSYDIVIGAGILENAGELMRGAVGVGSAAIVADGDVSGLYGDRCEAILRGSGYRTARFTFPGGERSKDAGTLISILDFLARERLSRTDVVVALGGGVTGDLAGFAAACYMRGVRYVQVPTTLLAMVDSSVGGKTAINLAAGKNLAGAFHQPALVVCDVSLLSTLTESAYRDGCAEVIKYGAIADRGLFDSLEEPIKGNYEAVVTRCVEIKRDIVAIDEFEDGPRKALNFGHTVGHAIEALSAYEVTHGHAVAAGMAIAARAAERMGILAAGGAGEIIRKLRLYGLPTTTGYGAAELAAACTSDKKRDGGAITMAFPTRIGSCVLKAVPMDGLESVIRSGLG
ncbi:MAG: 3-dehydroquinate synthase [Oscillospiraceae bacterium]|nr:3-dehydroquinate synthase [Oscillospiraceae bacterium]